MTTAVPRCRGCRSLLHVHSGSRRQWCSERCRKATLYAGTCEFCGGPTSGTNGRAAAAKVCRNCAEWPPPRIIEAIKRWAEDHGGVPPTRKDWQTSAVDHPAASTVYKRIGWNNALSWAGFNDRHFVTWTDAAIIAAIQRWAKRHNGRPPTRPDWKRATLDHPSLNTVKHQLGWEHALHRAGFTPSTCERSTVVAHAGFTTRKDRGEPARAGRPGRTRSAAGSGAP